MYWHYLGVGWGGGGRGEVESVLGEVELFGGESSPALTPLDETLARTTNDNGIHIHE
jgi:hypothetical protein